MDQAILNSCKRRYKRKLLAHTILEDESTDKSVPEILKAITWIKQYLSRKSRYKRKLLTHTIWTDKSVPEILKAITIQDVVYMITAA